MNVAHSDFNLQPYINPMSMDVNESKFLSMDVNEAKFLFLLRSRMVEIRTNFRNKYSDILCPVCNMYWSVVS